MGCKCFKIDCNVGCVISQSANCDSDVEKSVYSDHTNLRPYQLSQTADELRSSVDTKLDGFLIDDLADVKPQGGLEALRITYALAM